MTKHGLMIVKTWKPTASWPLAPCEGPTRHHGHTPGFGGQYSVVATVTTFPGAKTITVDSKTHKAYLFQPERGPAPAPAAGAPAPVPGRGRVPQGPIVAAWFISITQ